MKTLDPIRDLQHINLKLYAETNASYRLEDAITLFHRWIQEESLTEACPIDVASYAHVPSGPGVLLIAHHAFYSLEYGRERRLGLLYNQRTAMTGSSEQSASKRILSVFAKLWKAKLLVESQTPLHFTLNSIHLTINDRLWGKQYTHAQLLDILRPELNRVTEQLPAWIHSLEPQAHVPSKFIFEQAPDLTARDRFSLSFKAA